MTEDFRTLEEYLRTLEDVAGKTARHAAGMYNDDAEAVERLLAIHESVVFVTLQVEFSG